MRIRELHQRAFGHFTDDELKLIADDDEAGVPGLHVIYGANEAGKTTTLHAIRYGLYGIPDLRLDPRTYDFLHRKPDLRIAMVIDSAAGERLAFTQRKKQDNACFDITDTRPAPELKHKVEQLLGGIDRNLFTHKYGIDHVTLRAGGAGLAGDDNDVGESLFAAATGIVGVRATLGALTEQIDELLKSTGRAGRIHNAVKRYGDARSAVDRARTAGRSWVPKQKKIEQAQASLSVASIELAKAVADHERATQISAAIEHVVRRGLLLEKIDELGVVIEAWSADLEEQRKSLGATISTAETALRAATSELGAQMSKHAQLEAAVDEAVLAASDRAGHLGERIAEYRSARGDRSRLAGAVERAEESVLGACLAIRTGADPERARDLIPPLPAREAASALLGKHADLDREARAAAETLRECESALRALDSEQPAEAPALPDGLGVLRTAVNRVDTVVDTSRLAELDQRLQLSAKQLNDAAEALPRCTHSAEALLVLPVPLEQTLNEFDERLRAAEGRVDQVKAALAGPRESLETIEVEIVARADGGELPTLEELAELRGCRDRLWRRIRAAWTGTRAAENADAVEVGEEESIATAFEDVLGSADTYADRLVRVAEAAGANAALEQNRASVTAEIARHRAELASAQGELEEVESEWRALWAEIDVEPGSVAEMRGWLDGLRGVRKMAQASEADSVDSRALRARVERARTDLSAALSAAGRPPASDKISVEILQTSATEMLDAADRSRDRADKRDARRRDLEANREKARTRASAAAEALDAWGRQWDEAAPTIGLDAAALPDAGRAMLEAISALDEALGTLATARSAHEANDLLVTAFEQEVEELASSIGGGLTADLGGEPADQVMRTIARATADCAKAAEALAAIAPQIEALRGQERQHQDAITSATDGLERLAASTGLASVEELDAAALRWAQREDLRMQVATVERTIVEITKMRPDEVVSYLGDTPPEQLSVLITGCETAVEEASATRDELSETLGGLQRELGELTGAAQAEPHLAEMDDARAEIEQLATQYVPLKLQHELLSTYLREKAIEHMGPAMKRASALFSELTCGAYAGVTQDVDEANREVLQVVAPNGKPNKDRTGLSTGTCDQLYLALRVASIYQHLDVADNEPIPFVVDDILTTFDDERSAATMRVLAELATRTQVLFFTHHKHLVELARAEVPGEVLRVHTLG